MKIYIFPKKPFDYDLFVKGIADNGSIINEKIEGASESDVSALEELIGAEIPQDYKEYLLHCNGGMIDPSVTSRNIGMDPKGSINGSDNFGYKTIVVDFFYSLNKDVIASLSKMPIEFAPWYLPNAFSQFNELLQEDDDQFGLQDEILLPIGDTSPYGLVLSCKGAYQNKVLLLDSNEIPDTPLDNVALIADSFDDFIQSLYYESEI